MARIVVTGIAGELSGKLGGNVFSRNRAGAYVRANAIGTNPNTDAQIRARTAFATASSQYHSLTDTQKVGWMNFANTDFVPKGGTVPGRLSGFNAFVSMRSVIENAVQKNIATTSIDVATVAKTVTSTPFLVTHDAPTAMLESGLVDNASNTFGIELTGVAPLSASGLLSSATITLNPTGIIAPPSITDFVGHVAGGTTPVGFALYASKGQLQQKMFVENEEEYLIGYVKPLSFATATAFSDVQINFTNPQASAEYQQLPQTGEYSRFTLYTVSQNGMMVKVGGLIAQIG